MRRGIFCSRRLPPWRPARPSPKAATFDHGDTAAGIPIQEKKLKSGGLTLPLR